MKGSFNVIIENKRLRIEFSVKRKITLLRGNSGTGKTKLIKMLRESKLNNSTKLICNVKCEIITEHKWMRDIEDEENSILFIDENEDFLESTLFADVVKKSNNYFVLITRKDYKTLPYSIDEIYKLKSTIRGKCCYTTFEPVYKRNLENSLIYFNEENSYLNRLVLDNIVTEDSKSGYEFFEKLCINNKVECISANTNSGFLKRIEEYEQAKNKRNILLVLDSAAFGAYIPEVRCLNQ